MHDDAHSARARRIDLQLTGLIYARALRERAGASADELQVYTDEIRRQRERIERLRLEGA
jgi:hypothetical protein